VEAIAAPQVCYRNCSTSFPFPGATKGGTLNRRGSVSFAGSLSSQTLIDLQAIAFPTMLVPQTDPSPQHSPLNLIFIDGGAPKAA